MGRPRIKPVRGTIPEEKYELCCALIDLLNASGLTNLQVIKAAELTMQPQTFSRHLLGANGPSEQIVRAVIWTVSTQAGVDVGVIYQRFAPLRQFIDTGGVVLVEDKPQLTTREIMAQRVMPELVRGQEYRAIAVLAEEFAEQDSEIAAGMVSLAEWDTEACAALLVAFTRVHGGARADAVRALIREIAPTLYTELGQRVAALSVIAEADDTALALEREAAAQALLTSVKTDGRPVDRVAARAVALVRQGRMDEALRAWLRWRHTGHSIVTAADAARLLWGIMHVDRDGCLVAARLVEVAMTQYPELTAEAVLLNWLPGEVIPGSSEYRRFLRALHAQTFRALVASLLAQPTAQGDGVSRDRVDPALFFRAVDPAQVVWLVTQRDSSEFIVGLVLYIDVELTLRTSALQNIDNAVTFVHHFLRSLPTSRGFRTGSRSASRDPDCRFITGVARALCADYARVALVLGDVTDDHPSASAPLLWRLLLGLLPNQDPLMASVGLVLDNLGPQPVPGLQPMMRSDSQKVAGSLSDCFARLLAHRWNDSDGGWLLVRASYVCPVFTAHALLFLSQSGNPLHPASSLVWAFADRGEVAAVVLKHLAALATLSELEAIRSCAPMIARAAECCGNSEIDQAQRELGFGDRSQPRKPIS